MGGRDWKEVAQGLNPAAAMVVVQVAFAGLNILNKLALNDGMDVKILVAYRYIFAVVFISPLAFFVERKRRPKLTWKILGLSFLSGFTGATLTQNLYVASMKLTSPTYASAMSNLIPAVTFILAVSFRLESLGIRANYGQAKIIGTILALGGATFLTFYKGAEIKLWSSNINLLKLHDGGRHSAAPRSESGNRVMGSFLAVASCLCYALWLIIQAKLAQVYPYHYSSAALMCLMGSIQTSILALCFERHKSRWRIGFDIRLLTAVYSGIFSSGLAFTLLGWCIKKKCPLYASIFNPLTLVLVSILSSFLLSEKLYLGCVLGAVLVVIGLYMVLWGKGREASETSEESLAEAAREPIEVVVVQETTIADLTPGNLCEAKNNKEEKL